MHEKLKSSNNKLLTAQELKLQPAMKTKKQTTTM